MRRRSRIWIMIGAGRDEICLEKDSVESNMKPRFLADRLGNAQWAMPSGHNGFGGREGERERGFDYFRDLLRVTHKKEFSFRWIESEIVRRHPR